MLLAGENRSPALEELFLVSAARHRLLRADVVSSSSAIYIGSGDVADRQIIERPGGAMQVTSGGPQVAMAEQQLNSAQIGVRVEQVGGKGMPSMPNSA